MQTSTKTTMNGSNLSAGNAQSSPGRSAATKAPQNSHASQGSAVTPSNPANPSQHPSPSRPAVNGAHPTSKSKKKEPAPVDPAAMYESLKNRIAALEEEEVLEEEEEKRFAEEAQKSVKGLEETGIHAKYIELFAELKRMERDHAKEKQKLVKDKDAAKSQLTKANQSKTKMENLARELQKDNKRLREDSKRLTQSVEEAQDEISLMKRDMAKHVDKVRLQDVKYREMPDIVVKVVCRYRAELLFKISRKTKLSRLCNAWTHRMECHPDGKTAGGKVPTNGSGQMNGSARSDAAPAHGLSPTSSAKATMQFVFTHNGKVIEPDQSPEDAGLEDGDEILAVELMDLTEGLGTEDLGQLTESRRQTLAKNWSDDPREAQRTLEEIFDGVVREQLKELLRQYELRERHFECVIRSKELEVLLSRARAAEQKQLAEGEKARADKVEGENQQLKKDLDTAQHGQTMLIDKLIACCKEPNAERTQRLFTSLREELEKRGAAKFTEGPMGG